MRRARAPPPRRVLALLAASALLLLRHAVCETLVLGGLFPLSSTSIAKPTQRLAAAALAVEAHNAGAGAEGAPLLALDSRDTGGLPGRGAAEAFALPSPVAGVGAASSAVSVAAATVLGVLKTPMVSYSSTAGALSDKEAYPFFCRVVPSDDRQALAHLALVRSLGWGSVAVVHTSGSYGAGITEALLRAAPDAGVSVLASRSLRPRVNFGNETEAADREADEALAAVRASGARVVVGNLLLRDAQAVLAAARRAGMAGRGSGFVWIASDGWATADLFADQGFEGVTAADVEAAREAARGSLGVRPSEDPEAFAAVWAPESARLEAEYGAEAGSWAEPSPFTAHAYEAAAVVGRAVAEVAAAGGDPANGTELLAAVRRQRYDGVTGPVEFDESCDRLPGYGVYNFRADGTVPEVATWRAASGVELLPGAAYTWPDGGPAVPPDLAPRTVRDYSDANRAVVIAAQAVLCVTLAALHFALHLYRADAYVRAASVRLTHAMLAGAQASHLLVFPLAYGDSAWSRCALSVFGAAATFNLTFGLLVLRTLRVHLVFGGKNLRAKPPRDAKLLAAAALLCAWDAAVLLSVSLGSPPRLEVRSNPLDGDEDVEVCAAGAAWWAAFALVATPKVAVLGGGLALAYRVRNVAFNFNESRAMSQAMFVASFVLVVTVAAFAALRTAVGAALMILAVGTAVALLTLLLLVTVPRLLQARLMQSMGVPRRVSTAPLEPQAAVARWAASHSGGTAIDLSEPAVDLERVVCPNCAATVVTRSASKRRQMRSMTGDSGGGGGAKVAGEVVPPAIEESDDEDGGGGGGGGGGSRTPTDSYGEGDDTVYESRTVGGAAATSTSKQQ